MSSICPPYFLHEKRSLIHVWYHPIEPSRALHWAPLSSLLDHFRSRRKLCWMVVDCVQDQRWNCIGISSMLPFFTEILGFFGGPWIILGSHEGFYRSIIDFHSFWSILGEFWAAILEPVWRPRRLKMGKTSIFVPFLRASKRKAVSETILGWFSCRLERQKWAKVWECLLGFTFQPSQHKIDFGHVFDWILGGFGLHFGRFFGAKSEKVAFQSGLKRKAKNKAIKIHATNSG